KRAANPARTRSNNRAAHAVSGQSSAYCVRGSDSASSRWASRSAGSRHTERAPAARSASSDEQPPHSRPRTAPLPRAAGPSRRFLLPLRHDPLAQRLVAQVRRRRRADARLRRRRRLLAAPHALDPVRQVQQLAVRLVVEVLATLARPQHHLLVLALVALRVNLVAATVDVQRR